MRPCRRIEERAFEVGIPHRSDWIALDQRRHAAVARTWRADEEVGGRGLCDFAGKELAKRKPRYAAHNFTDEMAHVQAVITGGCAGRPPRRLRRQQRRRFFGVVYVFQSHRLVPAGDPGRMTHNVAHQHVPLSVGGEFRPVFCHRVIEIDLTAIGEHQGAKGRHGLGC